MSVGLVPAESLERSVFPPPLSLACMWPIPVSLHVVFSLYVSVFKLPPFYEDTSQTGSGPTPMTWF